MSSTIQDVTGTVQELTEEVRKAFRTAGHTYLDASDNVLESIVELQDQLKAEVDQKWLADVVDKQADFTRQLLKLNAAQREQLS
jgi:hypothetical protein